MRVSHWSSPLLILVVLGATSTADAGYMYARGSARDMDFNPSFDDEHSATDTAGDAYSAYAQGGASVYGQAAVDFNYLGVEAYATGPGILGGVELESGGYALQVETFRAFDANGIELTEGTLEGFFQIDGFVSGNADLLFGWEHRNDPDDDGGNSDYISWGALNTMGPLINVDELFAFLWPLAVGGVEVEIKMSASARTNYLGASGHSDFFSSASIDSIVYYNASGVADPTVRIVGTSGYVYPTPQGAEPVPEPASLALMGMGLIGTCVFAKRKQRLAA